ncbi:MAG TPA: acyltransferase [Casimicrobiaceae bacterium]|nr:acyltransferase [Casimicrobiaceae bacterium]
MSEKGSAVRTFGDLAVGRDNNLDLLRMAAATSVVFSHSYALTGRALAEPLVVASGARTDAATIGVTVFFAISGFLIAQSLARRRPLYAFAIARVLRIVPGLVFTKLICVFAIGWYATTFATADYFAHPQTWRFAAITPFFGVPTYLPGVFATNPYPLAINGSLWTIPLEAWCYVGAAVLAAATILFRPVLLALGIACLIGLYVPFQAAIRGVLPFGETVTVPGLVLAFMLGACLYACRRRIPVSLALAGATLALLALSAVTPFFALAYYAGITYVALALAYHPRLQITAYRRVGDYSYGTYVLAFPIQQLLVWRFGIQDALVLFAATMSVTLPLAALSWHFVEKPALKLKGPLAAWRPRLRYGLRRITRS